jgi:hypothetical protein
MFAYVAMYISPQQLDASQGGVCRPLKIDHEQGIRLPGLFIWVARGFMREKTTIW